MNIVLRGFTSGGAIPTFGYGGQIKKGKVKTDIFTSLFKNLWQTMTAVLYNPPK